MTDEVTTIKDGYKMQNGHQNIFKYKNKSNPSTVWSIVQ